MRVRPCDVRSQRSQGVIDEERQCRRLEAVVRLVDEMAETSCAHEGEHDALIVDCVRRRGVHHADGIRRSAAPQGEFSTVSP